MITKKTRALMIPSLVGNIPDYPKLRRVANKNKLWLIEDSCDTLGAKINGKSTGEYSDISTTSFYASHIITTAAHGGMVCFNKDKWFDKAKTLVGWGRSSAKNESESISSRFNIEADGIPYDAKFVFEEIGYNFQSSDIDAAFGLVQLTRLKKFYDARVRNFNKLYGFFKEYEDMFVLPVQKKNVETAWLAFPLIVRDSAPFTRRELVIYLEKQNIQTRPLFTGNVMRQPAYKKLKYKKTKLGYPISDLIMRGSFVIGCHQGMTSEQIEYLEDTFSEFIKKHS
jgi:CDP-6-deoxy-D-xylo-4-hexulose-3-dehydrase